MMRNKLIDPCLVNPVLDDHHVIVQIFVVQTPDNHTISIRFISNLCKNVLNPVLGRNLFYIENDCSVNPSDPSKMLVRKQMNYFYVPLEHAWKVSVLQELLNTRMNNIYVEGFDDYVITEMIYMLFNE